MKRIILDTNTYSSYLSGDEHILNVLSNAQIVFLSIFVIAELYFGFKGGNREIQNIELLDNFLSKPSVEILSATTETASIFADIKHSLKKAENPIPINDVWIASHAVETGSVLISYDEHFNFIPGIRLWHHLK